MKMEIVYRDPSELKAYTYNNRTHPPEQVKLIARSIKEFGFNQPVVIDRSGCIVVGHGRVLAANLSKLDEIPCVLAEGLTEEQVRAYRVLDNKLQNDSDWEATNMDLEVSFLDDAGFDIEGWGLDDFLTKEVDLDEDFDATDKPAHVFIQDGDLIELGPHRVKCGDSTSLLILDDLVHGQDVKLCVTDPPYGVEYDPGWRNEAAKKGSINYAARAEGEVTNDDKVDWDLVWYNLKSLGVEVMYVWHAGKHGAEVQEGLEKHSFEIVNQIVWAKDIFAISRGDYHWQHEPCFYAVKKGARHNWQGSRSESTLWKIGRGCKDKTGHSTEKPLECMLWPMQNNSQEGDFILDPFLGSGTSLIAAEKSGRRCLGVEISGEYCQMTVNRYIKLVGDEADIRINGDHVSLAVWTEMCAGEPGVDGV